MKRFTAETFAKYRHPSSPLISPDGRLTAFVLTETDLEKNCYRADLWVLENETGTVRRLTAQGDAFSFAWTPDGRIVFAAPRGDEVSSARKEGRMLTRYFVISPWGGEAALKPSRRDGLPCGPNRNPAGTWGNIHRGGIEWHQRARTPYPAERSLFMEKTIPCRWFMGCNSQNGFYSLFGQFTRPEEGWRCILIKGGPGTGKSTLMKRVIKLALQRGQPVEEIHCSSDAASLDGVILPRQRTVLLDATPPHALEPQFPGAVEQPFSLCGCWDEELLFTRREEIVQLGREISGLHWQAVRYLSGAGALLGEVRRLAAETLNWEKIEHYVQRLAARELPDRGKPGSEALRLLSAVTDRGVILFHETISTLCERVICLEDPCGAAAAVLLPRLRDEAVARGYHVISCPCPLSPEKLDHLLIPEAGLAFVTSNSLHRVPLAGRAIHAQRFTDDSSAIKSRRVRIRFLQKTAATLLRQAELAIAEAHRRHDELEQYYIEATNFAEVDRLAEGLLKKLAAEM